MESILWPPDFQGDEADVGLVGLCWVRAKTVWTVCKNTTSLGVVADRRERRGKVYEILVQLRRG
jgi:hypothetical protein